MDDLFGRSTRSNSLANDKKKVKFEDENDPLANLDFSDDDSQNSLDNASKQEQPIVNAKKLSHLFGIQTDNRNEEAETKLTEDPVNATSEALKEDSTLNVSVEASLEKLSQPQKSSSRESNLFASSDNATASNLGNLAERKSATAMRSIFSNDSQDIISNLADKPKATASAQSKKSLMEDLFGRESSVLADSASKTKSTFSSSPSVTRMNSADSNTGPANEAASKLASASSTAGYSLSAPKEPRRGRRSSATIQNDPFGYLSASSLQFGESPRKPEEKQSAPAVVPGLPAKPTAVVNESLPEWLGGSKSSKEQSQDKAPPPPPIQSDLFPSAKSTENPKATSEPKPSLSLSKGMEGVDKSNLTSTLLGMEFNQQTALINMQQQEHELRTATALSQQTEKLNYLLETQRMKLGEQEKQFNALIAKQLERQTLIEAQIKAQQDRIDNYIQTLAAQPTTLPLMSVPMSLSIPAKNADADNAVESESLLHKVQLEKLYLENTLESLREKHDQEISILEESYKKQITHLEEALVQMEKRAQDDIEGLEADYRLKIQKLKEDLSDCEKARKEERAILLEENSQLVRDIQERHSKNLESLQKEHLEIIDKLTKSKESEREAIKVMTTEGTNVQNVLTKSEFLIESLGNLQRKFENKDKNFSDLQENHFSAQEKNIEYLKNLLESQKEEFDKEKQRFMTTTQKLESNILELTKEFQKQNANLQISEEILKSKEQALLRDREIFVEQMNWERERLKAMMEAWAKEEDKQLEWLAQERQALASERGKLQIFNRLKNQVDESLKIELEAAIKAAQEAAFSANQERVKWQEKIKELDKKQYILEQEEHLLIEKARELQEFTQSAISKREEGLKALKEAHFIEQRYKEKFSQLHHQQEILIEKESKLAAEKLELAKTRLSLHVSQAEKPEKDGDDVNQTCPEKQVANHSDVPTSASDCTTYFKDIVDPHLVILKWDLENNLGFSQTTF